jgi:hypothetical protein
MLLLVTCLYPPDATGHQQRVKVHLCPMRLLMMIRRVTVMSTNTYRGGLGDIRYSVVPSIHPCNHSRGRSLKCAYFP